jgi:hypothetical protein
MSRALLTWNKDKEVLMSTHALPHTHNLSDHHETPLFRGFLTKLLHEAFYFEEDSDIGLDLENNSTFEEEDETDQKNFIQGFLKPFL